MGHQIDEEQLLTENLTNTWDADKAINAEPVQSVNYKTLRYETPDTKFINKEETIRFQLTRITIYAWHNSSKMYCPHHLQYHIYNLSFQQMCMSLILTKYYSEI